jgi:hypothetical protein
MELRTLLVFIGGLVIVTLGGYIGGVIAFHVFLVDPAMDEATGFAIVAYSVILGGLVGATLTFFWWRSEVRKIRRAMKASGS